MLPAAFKDFHARLPAVDVQFSETVLPWMLGRLREGSLDFAVAHVVPGRLDPQFEAMELFPVRLVVGLRERHPLRASRSIRELYKAEWILPGRRPFQRPRGRVAAAATGLTAAGAGDPGQSVTVALALVGQMDLVGLFVEPLATLTFKRHGIRRVAIEEELPMLSVSVIKRRGQLLTPAAQHFVECIQRASAVAMGAELERAADAGVAGLPGRVLVHGALEQVRGGPARPCLQAGPGPCIEPRGLDHCELAHEGHDGGIGQRGVRASQAGRSRQPGFESRRNRAPRSRAGSAAIRMPVRVLVAVELRLETVVADGDQCEHVLQRAGVGLQPAQRVVAVQGPQHHVEAQLQHRAVVQSHSTGTVPFGEAASISVGLFFSTTSRSSQRWPLAISASRARIA